ncbi:MAG TPA: hypothetical protein VGI70_09225 [Polyangiales bacterium]|jgi:uncharacterized membrane protein
MNVRFAIRSAALVFALGYPLVVYFGLARFGTRGAASLLLAIAIVHTLVRSRERRRFAWASALAIPLCLGALFLDDKRYVLAMPVIVNGALFASFFGSLFGERPLVERFARMRVSELSPAEVRYCRSVTKVWSAFFVFNGGSAAALALFGKLELWTLYTGLVSYILVGTLGATEYTIRKYRFGRYSNGWHDRLLRAILPVRSAPP